ncbi:hypothetical protein WN51_00891 [Melipona quadrifasciata]|uniref:Uncharacterized protein n=1 Tax=Melipona quadrifasciata TaxID=166423 RepID=A0A0M9ADD4_9HYME|nr:hypothetical protein WN51_00891 [Melipona quadrifasciata]
MARFQGARMRVESGENRIFLCTWRSTSSRRRGSAALGRRQAASSTSCPDHLRRVGPSVPDIAPRPRDRQGFAVARPKFFTGLSSGGNSSAWQVGSALHAIRRQGGPKGERAERQNGDATQQKSRTTRLIRLNSTDLPTRRQMANGKWQIQLWYACRQVKEANEHCIASVSAKMSS